MVKNNLVKSELLIPLWYLGCPFADLDEPLIAKDRDAMYLRKGTSAVCGT